MISQLMRTGSLPFWDWVWFGLLWLVVLIGIGALAVIYRTRPPRRPK